MDRKDFATALGLKSRQHVDYVLNGQRNLILWRARIATKLIGGDIETWMDRTRREERLALFNAQNKEAA